MPTPDRRPFHPHSMNDCAASATRTTPSAGRPRTHWSQQPCGLLVSRSTSPVRPRTQTRTPGQRNQWLYPTRGHTGEEPRVNRATRYRADSIRWSPISAATVDGVERRQDIERRRVKQLSKQARDVEDILAFARIWAPFGGVPEDETFIKFGMRPWRFLEKLWHILSEMPCDRAEVDQLRQAFPPAAGAVTGSDSDFPSTSDGEPLPGCPP